MEIIKTFEMEEIPNPHFISVRALHVSDQAQFEHLMLEAGDEQKKHIAFTNVYLYILEGSGLLEVGEETVTLSSDMLIEMPTQTPHRLINNGKERLRILNIKAPRPTKATHIVSERR
jgi:mannose-6-phosphate isomerase-like protein (cupin superfamily)